MQEQGNDDVITTRCLKSNSLWTNNQVKLNNCENQAVGVDFKINNTPSMEMQIRKLRIEMDSWKHFILHINSVLMWEKHWHSTAITSGTTVFFMLLWLCNPNLLTVLSILGLILTIADYAVPALSLTLFKQELTEEQQKQFADICTNIVLLKTKTELFFTSYFRLRVTNPKLYISVTVISLCILAWIGAAINNLFLVYLLVTFLLLAPGLDHNGMLDKWTGWLSKIFTELVENAKLKVGQHTKKIE